MKATVQRAYEALPPEVQEAMEQLILSLSRQHLPTPADGRDPNRPFAGLPGLGSMKGKIWMADDFDETPEDFKDYI